MQTQTQTSQAEMTPAAALARLKEGNARFVANRQAERDLMEQVRLTGGGQYPFAIVLGCVDSRVPPEVIFDQGIGDIFSARIAGNFVNTDILGSMEFACKVAGAKLILVLGHSQCGAIMGATDGAELGNLTGMLRKLQPAVDATPAPLDRRNSQNAAFVQQVAEKNVELTVEAIKQHSPVLREMLDNDEIAIAGAMYDVESGIVRFL
ncbi:MAG: carbonic anhydrase [Anaerolineae bacterium]|nr:carbonic anhydrase [Anaerolineae bacterium]